MAIHELVPTQNWACPSCGGVDQTHVAEPNSRMHACPALRGMTVPFVQVPRPGDIPHARHVEVMAEDYTGDNDSPVAAIRTERPDGSHDVNVYPRPAKALLT